MNYDQARAFRAELLEDAPTRVRLADDDEPDAPIGTVLPMDDTSTSILVKAAGSDAELMVCVQWSTTYTCPEYVEDLRKNT